MSLWIAMTLAASARAAVVDDLVFAVFTTLFWALVQGAGLWFAWANDGPPPRKVTDVVAGIGLLAFLAELLSSGLVQALMSLLLWLQAARNPVLRARRDAYFALAIGLVLVMFGATEARSSAFLVILVGFGFAALSVLVYCHQQGGLEAEAAGESAAATVSVPSLPLVHVGLLAGSIFLLATAWYLLVPRPDPVNFGSVSSRGGDKYSSPDWESEADGKKKPGARDRPADAKGDGAPRRREKPTAGDDSQLDITRANQNQNGQPANAIVMYVQADGPLYLRERSFDRYEHDRWDRSDLATRKLRQSERQFHFNGPEGGTKREYVVQVVLARGTAIPLSAHVKTLSAPVPVVGLAKDHSVHLPARIEPGFRYSAVSVLSGGHDRPISHDALDPRERYMQLPGDFSSRIGDLAREVTAGSSSPLQKAVALESHLRGAYAYSFETTFTSQNVTPLEDFLFVSRRGHCEFFASAMAVMLRSIGIPSRVVNGFLAHSYNPVTGFYEVRAFDGHAWVEAHIEGIGWMTFEPTAAYPLPQRQGQTGTALRDLKEYTEKLSQQEALRGVTSMTATVAQVMRVLAESWHELVLRSRIAADAFQSWLAAHALALGAVLMALSALVVVGYRNRARMSWWLAKLIVRLSPSAKVSIAAVRQIDRVARMKDRGRAPGQTVDEYLERLEALYPELHAELDILRREFNATRYDGREGGPGGSASVVDAFHAVGARLRES